VVFYDESEGAVNLSIVSDLSNDTKNKTSTVTIYRRVKFEIPAFVNASGIELNGFSIGYRHMCRFHAKGVYRNPILTDVDYALRLDHDSEFLSPIRYDIFEHMRRNDFVYGYVLISTANIGYLKGLREAVSSYVQNVSIVPQPNYRDWKWPNIYYNNFEISSLKLWKSKHYEDFIEYVDRLGGIYYNRWGDAPIKTLAVFLFVPPKRVHRFTDVMYRHKQLTSKNI